MKNKTAILIGATGLVGGHILEELIENENYDLIKIFGRRKIEINNKKIVQYEIDFNKLIDYKDLITGDDLFSSLGTTLKKSGSKDSQYKVDYTYQYEFAKIASQNNVKNYFLVSSSGANEKALIFYMKMKGELDRDVMLLNFEKINIFRPAALVGKREEERTVETVTIKIGNFLARTIPDSRSYRPILGSTVAKAIINCANTKSTKKIEIISLGEIFEKAGIDYKQKNI